MKKNLQIGIDFDGVIADTMALKRSLAKKLYSVDIPAERFKEDMVVEDGRMSREQYRRLMAKVCGTYLHGRKAKEVLGAVSAIKDFLLSGHTCTVITSREGKEVVVAEEWLQNHGISIPIISVGYKKSKVEAISSLDIYIDDDVYKLEMPNVSGVKLFILDCEHNKNVHLGKHITRVKTWSEFRRMIELTHTI